MPFKSKKQMRAAFGGYLGPEMKRKAKQWAEETPNIKSLPMRKKPKGSGEFTNAEIKQGYKKLEDIHPFFDTSTNYDSNGGKRR
jgi:hypothetical protein